jgi:hypothetical protein
MAQPNNEHRPQILQLHLFCFLHARCAAIIATFGFALPALKLE